MTPYQGLGVGQGDDQRGHSGFVTPVAERDRDIPQHTSPFCAHDGRAAEPLVELFCAHADQIEQPGSGAIDVDRVERSLRRGPGERCGQGHTS